MLFSAWVRFFALPLLKAKGCVYSSFPFIMGNRNGNRIGKQAMGMGGEA